MKPSFRLLAGAAHPPRPAGGFHPALPGRGHRYLAKALGASMFFFIFYRGYHDGPALIGLRHPWDGHGHGHGHGDEEHH
ncbi:hypothetical protein P389DRAFT_171232 [Cystobasidium minutum MCA 4210]|uniref:uncharacterized protein n=1 Tax=Cystobasidium minutum MCA 4210 TaxID=1397322 RepID=UPI0034CD608A|eukprot:jgi/Rhomi1/171232/fgenesh1_kg.4_\